MTQSQVEIKRVWILPSDSLSLIEKKATHCIPHVISYLFSEGHGEMRVVKRWTPDGIKYAVTVKNRGDLVRQDWEDNNLPLWVYQILSLQAKCSIQKDRYFVPHNQDYTLEVDKYQNRSIYYHFVSGQPLRRVKTDVMDKLRLECEFPSVEAANAFKLPLWARGATEITSDSRYKNAAIAENGWPKEKEK